MLIPHTLLNADTLDELLIDFVTRVGTDDDPTPVTQRKAQLLRQLETEQAFVTYNYEHMQACLVPRSELSDAAILEFKESRQSMIDSAAEQAEEQKAKDAFTTLHGQLSHAGVFPIDLGRTVMSGATNALMQEGRYSLQQLQDLLYRHSTGDYGAVCWADKLSNLQSIHNKGYMLSRYALGGVDLYVEMLAGWPQTMVLLVSER
ncbi:YheU family protein [Pseudomonas aeruginosa]|uniref:YheU family protein n=1 Tax=Pseudomonas aeruginosa TaxID=287 RepID=UPI0034E06B7A